MGLRKDNVTFAEYHSRQSQLNSRYTSRASSRNGSRSRYWLPLFYKQNTFRLFTFIIHLYLFVSYSLSFLVSYPTVHVLAHVKVQYVEMMQTRLKTWKVTLRWMLRYEKCWHHQVTKEIKIIVMQVPDPENRSEDE